MVDQSVWGGLPDYLNGMFKTKKKKAEPTTPVPVERSARDTPEAMNTLNRGFDALMSEQGMGSEPIPKESNASAIQRGVSGLLGFVPKGGTRGDAADGFANIGRALMGMNSVQQMENDYNQSVAPEKLRRALETGDVEAIKRLDPQSARQVQVVDQTTRTNKFEDAYREAIAAGDYEKAAQIDAAAASQYNTATEDRDTVIRATGARMASAASQLAGEDPAKYYAAVQQFANEMPGVLDENAMAIAKTGDHAALIEYLRDPTKASGASAGRFQAGVWFNPETGQNENVMFSPGDPNPQRDVNGNLIRPQSQISTKEAGPGIFVGFDGRPADAAGPKPGGAGSVVPAAAPAAPASGGGAPVAAPAPTPARGSGVGGVNTSVPAPAAPAVATAPPAATGTPLGGLTNRVIAAEAAQAYAKGDATARAAIAVEAQDKLESAKTFSSAITNRVDKINELSDEDLQAVIGLPGGGIAKGGIGGFGAIPGTPASRAALAVKGLESAVRLEGFQAVRGAGQVTETESQFAADAIAVLKDAKFSTVEQYREEVNRVQAMSNLAQETARARAWAAKNGYDFSDVATGGDEKIKAMRELYAAQDPRAANVFREAERVLASGKSAPAATGGYAEGTVITNKATGESMVRRNGQWVKQ